MNEIRTRIEYKCPNCGVSSSRYLAVSVEAILYIAVAIVSYILGSMLG